jgi:hypothetical protein
MERSRGNAYSKPLTTEDTGDTEEFLVVVHTNTRLGLLRQARGLRLAGDSQGGCRYVNCYASSFSSSSSRNS